MLEGLVPPKPFQTKEEYIYETLRAAILQCKLPPGEKLVIDHLSSVLGVSAIPIRAALQRLQSDGLVEIVPHTGAVVSEISIDDLTEIFTILEALESIAFEYASQRATDSDLVKLEDLVNGMDQAYQNGDIDRWSELNTEFHCSISGITQMDLLKEYTCRTFSFWERIRRYYLKEIVSYRIPKAQVEHHEMIELLKGRKSKELAAKASQHNRQAREAYEKLIQSHLPKQVPELEN